MVLPVDWGGTDEILDAFKDQNPATANDLFSASYKGDPSASVSTEGFRHVWYIESFGYSDHRKLTDLTISFDDGVISASVGDEMLSHPLPLRGLPELPAPNPAAPCRRKNSLWIGHKTDAPSASFTQTLNFSRSLRGTELRLRI